MSGSVISHREQRRKRGGASDWTARRIAVLVIAAAAIMAASWLAPELNRPETKTPLPQRAQPMPPLAPAELSTPVDAAIDLAVPPPPRPERTRPRRTGVPLNANADIEPAGYEILSAGELAGISQAHE
jgi:hypothetical protein